MASLTFQLLGRFAIYEDKAPLTNFKQPRLQAFLSYLLLAQDGPVSRQQLAFLFWPDSTDKQAQANLRKLLYELRRRLPQTNDLLEITSRTIRWQANAAFSVDVTSFQAYVDQAKTAVGSTAAKQALEKAVALYAGDLLPAFYDNWVLAERDRLRELYASALQRLAELAETERDYKAALAWTQRLLQYDPLRETSHQEMMRLHLLAGDRAKALSSYHLCATTLSEELGVDPSSETEEIRQRILRLEEGNEREETAVLTSTVPLVGRNEEWQQLAAAWQQAQKGKASLFLVQGEGGIGKTRLAEELVDAVRRQGIAVAHTRAFAAQGAAAYAPVAGLLRQKPYAQALATLETVWLTELARLLPELLEAHPNLTLPHPMKEAWQQQRFHEALARGCLAIGQPMLLHFDDLQWCDAESLAWLRFLLDFEPKAKLFVVGTVRDDEIDETHPVYRLHLDLQRRGRSQALTLQPLGVNAVAKLATKVVGQTMSAAAAANLFADTEGSPLFVLEMLRAGGESFETFETERAVGAENGNAQGGRRLPPKVQAVIQWRLRQLSKSARQLVAKAAVFGRSFTAQLLLQANQGQEEEVIFALDELWRRRIIREQGADSYDFSHDRIREVAYQEISPIMRRHWHRQAAQALESNEVSLRETASQIAIHYKLAGLHKQSITYFQMAAQHATRTFSNKQAIDYLGEAIELAESNELSLRFDLLRERQELYSLTLQPEEQLFDLQSMESLAKKIEENEPNQVIPRTITYLKLGQRDTHFSTNVGKAVFHLQNAISLAQLSGEDELEATAQLSLGFAYFQGAEFNLAAVALKRCLALTIDEKYLSLRAHAYEQLAAVFMFTGDSAKIIEAHLREAHALFQRTNNLQGLANTFNKLGYLITAQGEGIYKDAVEHYQRGLKICQDIEYARLEPIISKNLGVLHTLAGEYHNAYEYFQRTREKHNQAHIFYDASAVMSHTAFMYLNLGDYNKADELQQEALKQHRRSGEGVALSQLGLSHYLQGKHLSALKNLEQGLVIATEIGDLRERGYALTRQGLVLIALERFAEAKTALDEAFALHTQLEQTNRSMGAIAGLADLALQQGNLAEARTRAEQLFNHLQIRQLDKTDESLLVFMSAYRVFDRLGDKRAAPMLQQGHSQLQQRAATFWDESLLEPFWAAPLHAQVAAEYQQKVDSSLS
ncbi:MAG: BTAD domain-containing putative transcriptional regulator [Chloroflexota bacterium]